jgi:putative aminopeptidase FrvX
MRVVSLCQWIIRAGYGLFNRKRAILETLADGSTRSCRLTPREFRIQSGNDMASPPELLTKLSQTHGASGHEDAVRAFVLREFKKLTDRIEITPLGSVIGIKRAAPRPAGKRSRRAAASSDAPRLLVEAHMDEIGLIVTEIQDGFIRFEEVGYWDPRVLPSQNVLVHGRQTLPGVIGSRPPHVLSAQERSESLPLRQLFVDVGMSDARVRELVSPGDVITLDRAVMPLQNNFYAGKAFDDRASLVALLEFLRQLQAAPHAWDIYAAATVNEEDSSVYVGAQTAAFQIRPHIAICLDVTHAQQVGLNDDALARVGAGPCIARGANVHPFVFEKLQQAARRESIPHQITVYGGNTETNAWMMQVAGDGIPTALLEIPLRYMHSSVETIELSDVTHLAELLRVFATALTRDDVRALQGETFVRRVRKTTPRHVSSQSTARKTRARRKR